MQPSQKGPQRLPPQAPAHSERSHPWFPATPSSSPPSTEEPHGPLGAHNSAYRAPPSPERPHHRPPPDPPTLRGLTPNLPPRLPAAATHLSPCLPRLPSHCVSWNFPAAPPPFPGQLQIVKELDSHVGFCFLFFFVSGAPPAGPPARHLLGSHPPRSGFIHPAARPPPWGHPFVLMVPPHASARFLLR